MTLKLIVNYSNFLECNFSGSCLEGFPLICNRFKRKKNNRNNIKNNICFLTHFLSGTGDNSLGKMSAIWLPLHTSILKCLVHLQRSGTGGHLERTGIRRSVSASRGAAAGGRIVKKSRTVQTQLTLDAGMAF